MPKPAQSALPDGGVGIRVEAQERRLSWKSRSALLLPVRSAFSHFGVLSELYSVKDGENICVKFPEGLGDRTAGD